MVHNHSGSGNAHQGLNLFEPNKKSHSNLVTGSGGDIYGSTHSSDQGTKLYEQLGISSIEASVSDSPQKKNKLRKMT